MTRPETRELSRPLSLLLACVAALGCSEPDSGADGAPPDASPEDGTAPVADASDPQDGRAVPRPDASAVDGSPVDAERRADAAPPLDGVPGEYELTYDERDYFMYVPPGYASETPIPLLIGFHGACKTASEFYRHDGIELIRAGADPANFILIIPDTKGGCCCDEDGDFCADFVLWTPSCDPSDAAPQMGDEMDELWALIDEVGRHYRLDRSQIHAFGHSDGGLFTGIGGMWRSDRFASLLIFASGWGAGYPLFRPTRSIPVQFVCGADDDPFCPAAQESATFLSDAGHPVRVEVIPNEGHGLEDLVENVPPSDFFAWMRAHPLP